MQATTVGLWCCAYHGDQALYGTVGVDHGARALCSIDGLPTRMGGGADLHHCQPGWVGVRTSMPLCELMDIGVVGGDCDRKL
jgi:hypothetical protein